MSEAGLDGRRRNRIRWLAWVGAAIFVAAYFLPSVSSGSHDPKFFGGDHGVPGYACADLATRFVLGKSLGLQGRDVPLFVSVALSDALNLLAPLYLILSARWKRWGVWAVVLCCADTLPAVHWLDLTPRIGCYLWLLGALMLISPEVGGLRRFAGQRS
jgi:hypothetical protein